MALTTRTVVATYVDAEGTALAGTVDFAPVVVVSDESTDTFRPPSAVTVTLDDTGSLSITLPCTDNADLAPSGWAWRVTERIDGAPARRYDVSLLSSESDPVGLTDLAPATSLASPYAAHTHTFTATASTLAVGEPATATVAATPDGGAAFTFGIPAGGQIAETEYTDSATLALADADRIVRANKATAMTVTVPTNASVAFPVGTTVLVVMAGAGAVTLAAAGGVTLRAPGGWLRLATQYEQAVLIKRATDEWYVAGGLSA